jgi:formylglycine-generating enzyme required for sulfatase activity
VDTTGINSYVIYAENSNARSNTPSAVQPNPFGLINMLGNVAEFCSDWYSPETYAGYPEGTLQDPTGPPSGEEYVIRGGSYLDDAARVRSASRDFTRSGPWLKTDPQIPKSVWWYSDCTHVGFRVVCEYDEQMVSK